MKLKILLLLILLSLNSSVFCLDLSVMTYNICFDDTEDSLHAWSSRRDAVIGMIRAGAADIFGLQEALLGQVNDIASRMPGYDWVGVAREDGINRGEYVPVFYNSQRYQLKKQGWFWLSETPSVPSVGWDASMPRICTYALLEDYDTRKNFWVFNTHLDHAGEKSRHEACRLINRKIHELNEKKLPVVLMGDFNTEQFELPVRIIKRRLKDSREESLLPPAGPSGTVNNFNQDNQPGKRIDYIFVNRKVKIGRAS
ncbi:MAG: endonuclease/exonuclease/phosphatase family protein, partial [Mangrovibacterium sp.]